jgi:hypothetical protein
LFLNEYDRTLNLQPAHARPRQHVPFRPDYDRHWREAMPARRMIEPHVAHQPGSPRSHADQADFGGLFGGHRARELKTGAQRIRFPKPFSRLVHFAERDAKFGKQLRRTLGFQIVFAAAGTAEAAAETVAAKQRGEVQKIAPNFPARGSRGQKRDIVGQRAKVAGVIREPLQFKRDGTQPLGAQRRFRAGERFENRRISRRVPDSGVASDRFNRVHRRAMRSAEKSFFNAAMLVAKCDFQMQHFLAVTLKTEMARLNNARVNRPDRDFVNLAAFDAKEFSIRRMIAVLPPHRLQPRKTFGHQAVLFPNFALEQMRLRMQQRERRITFCHRRAIFAKIILIEHLCIKIESK